MQANHPAFELLRTEDIPALNVTVEEYQHTATGAQHIHLRADNPENVFMVALRTVPEDSTGVAHILEHTALCGSARYPVRDPFFMMTRRSLNTFMNALTRSDWTADPFASVNRKDFDNLLDVYLDAVFFSRLDPLDFAQEGHRLEFSEPDNADSPLEFKGVVYNEMKGAMSSVPSILWQTINKYLHPATTYHHNSGGEPDCIPDLTYEQMLAFYKTHYHPSNAVFMTYGDIPVGELQTRFEEQALTQFQRLPTRISVPDEKRLYAPIRVEEAYPVGEDEDCSRKTHVVMGWLLGPSTDLDSVLTAHLIANVLLDNSASPLMHALETTDLGSAPSPLCGLDDSQKELTFVCGLEGCSSEQVAEVEALITSTLQEVAQNGLPQEDLEAALHLLELHQREVGGGHYPYGLQLLLNALTAATHDGDPVAVLNVDDALQKLRAATADPDFLNKQIHQLFLDNPHRVRLSLVPDPQINARKNAAELARLAKIKEDLSEQERAEIIRQSQALAERQVQEDDPDILPKVTLEDVPKEESHLAPETLQLPQTQRPLSTYSVGSNGLVYQQVIMDMPDLDETLINYLPFYTNCLTEVGIGEQSYMDVQRRQARVSGGISAFSSLRSKVDDIHSTNNFIVMSGKALNRNHEPLCELMDTTLSSARFDEGNRIREMIAQIRASQEQGVTGSGHVLAMNAAASGMCAASKLGHELGGLVGIQRLKALDERLKDKGELKQFCEQLTQIHAQLQQAPRRFLLIGEGDQLPQLRDTFNEHFDRSQDGDAFAPFELPHYTGKVQQAWLTNTQVNFCAKAYPTVPMTHPDAAPLVILGNVLRNGYLHRTIREQGGAYGGGASQDNGAAAFRFFSYRDPRLGETLADFDRAVEWLLGADLKWQTVEEAILGTISGIDKPDSPAGRAKRLYHAELNGRTLAHRQQFRERLLATTGKDLQRVAQTYLRPENANTAVISDPSRSAQLADLDLELIKL